MDFPQDNFHWRSITEFWQDAAMDTALAIQFALCPMVLLGLLWVTAPYGRHHRAGWGPALPGRVAWIVMELPALLTISLIVLASPVSGQVQAWLPLLFWIIHYSYRTFLFPALMRPSDKAFPLLLVVFAIAFNLLNGYNNAGALLTAGERSEPMLSLHFMTGTALFFFGFWMHYVSDRTIRNLREPGESGYRIPEGGWFRWVSSPHYLGEIIQWCGWALLTWSAAGAAFALFTFCNLAPRALSNHRWYRERFPAYPVERKALIPGIL